MGLEINCPEDAPIPRPVHLRVECDGDPSKHHSSANLFISLVGYVSARKEATECGWRFTGSGKVFGPCCPKEGTKAYKGPVAVAIEGAQP